MGGRVSIQIIGRAIADVRRGDVRGIDANRIRSRRETGEKVVTIRIRGIERLAAVPDAVVVEVDIDIDAGKPRFAAVLDAIAVRVDPDPVADAAIDGIGPLDGQEQAVRGNLDRSRVGDRFAGELFAWLHGRLENDLELLADPKRPGNREACAIQRKRRAGAIVGNAGPCLPRAPDGEAVFGRTGNIVHFGRKIVGHGEGSRNRGPRAVRPADVIFQRVSGADFAVTALIDDDG